MRTGIRREGSERGRGQVDGLNWKDVERVCSFAEASKTLAGLRDFAMMNLMSDCLLRISHESPQLWKPYRSLRRISKTCIPVCREVKPMIRKLDLPCLTTTLLAAATSVAIFLFEGDAILSKIADVLALTIALMIAILAVFTDGN